MYGNNPGSGAGGLGGAIAAGSALASVNYALTGPVLAGVACVIASLVALRGRRLAERAF
jgi:hypothetical protein